MSGDGYAIEGWNDIDVDWTGYPVNRVEGYSLAIDVRPIH